MNLSRRRLFLCARTSWWGGGGLSVLPDGAARAGDFFRHLPAITFDVASIDVQQPFVSSGQPPSIESQIPVTPAQVARNWARDRLKAGGADGVARYAILDASVREVALKTDKSLTGLLKTQQESKLEGRVEVRIDINSSRARVSPMPSRPAARPSRKG